MNDAQGLARLLDYDSWANRETLGSLKGVRAPQALTIMGHIIGAEWLWQDRIKGHTQTLPVWPDLSLEVCAERLAELKELWRGILSTELSRAVPYTNSKGQAWSSTVFDILTHVVIHSAYHRGQVAMAVRSSGHEPAYTDFIHSVRQGLIGPK
jgi:uncharacterized damage-inducible protein DinB